MNPFILVHSQNYDGKSHPFLLNINQVVAFIPTGSGGDAEPVLALTSALDEDGDPRAWDLEEDLGEIEQIIDGIGRRPGTGERI